MIFWYRNSVLASIVSILGCVIALAGFGAMRSRELSVGEGIAVIAVGVLLAILGKVISDRKLKKQQEQARMAQNAGDPFSAQNAGYTGTAQNTGNAGQSAFGYTSYGPQNAGSTRSSAGTARNTAGSTAGAAGNTEKEGFRFCPRCGASLVPGAVFCSACGTQIKAPSSGSTAQETRNTAGPGGAAQETQRTADPDAALKEILLRANAYAEKGEYQKELDTLLSGLAVNDSHAVLLNRIGRAYRRLGDYRSALDYYFRSARVDPDEPSIGTNIATAYMFLGEYEQADRYFDSEIRKLEASGDPEAKNVLKIAYANYAQCAGRSGDLNKARDLLFKAEKAGYENCDQVWNMLFKS